MRLLIAIPALNEEDSIASIIERCLAARSHIIANSPVTDVEITVVSDGSTDQTVDIARRYTEQVDLIVFEKNRGYGAAITAAWQQSKADLLSFLDADGTCDPRYFAEFCRELVEQEADVVLGCRINAQSRMPLVRRVGNAVFALMLSVFAMTRVRDTASGMRVVRRSSLRRLFPLPDGLHFTPAMSARAMLSRSVKLIEVDMAYHERVGESKLHVVRDGLRFFRVILETAMLYRPSRPLGLVAFALLAVTGAMMITPIASVVVDGQLPGWMIYRFLVGELFTTIAVLIGTVTFLGNKAVDISLSESPAADKYHGIWGWIFSRCWFWAIPTGLLAAGTAFVVEPLRSFVASGEVTAHWSLFVSMMGCFSCAAILVVAKTVDYCLNLLADRLSYLKDESWPTIVSFPEPEYSEITRRAA